MGTMISGASMISNSDSINCLTCNDEHFVKIEDERLEPKYGKEFADAHPTVTPCPDCSGSAQHAQHAIKNSQMPDDYQNKRMNDFSWEIYLQDKNVKREEIEKKIKQPINSFINEFEKWKRNGEGLYFWSKERGSGKSLMASAILNELLQRRIIRTAKFVQERELIELDKAGKIYEIKNCDLLILDDVGMKTNGNTWLSEIYFDIFDSRMHSKKITIVTANQRFMNLPFDDRVINRINSTLIEVHFPEVDVRAIFAQKKHASFLKKLGLF